MPVNLAPEFRPLLFGALIEALRHAAEAVVRCGTDPADYPAALADFDRTRATLDAAGWGASSTIDIDPHRDVLQEALSARLGIERYLEAETGDHAEGQRQRAHKRVVEIERFMHDAGLVIPSVEDDPA
ncbi:MAG TPA: hypothetical protein VL979_08270 [Solirubrobacteraceae bacterium]|nr:hypothetical protein [Solirubrobacteraceae bacterium]